MLTKLSARAERKNLRRDDRKRQLALSALEALKALGYANTSLRDIAETSELSLGMLHYYFEDKSDLIIHCVTIYKQDFMAEMLGALDNVRGRAAVIDTFAEALTMSIVDRDSTHRLWYDIRNQAVFDATFRPVVDEIEGSLMSIVAMAIKQAELASEPPVLSVYTMLDGVFRWVMQGQITGAAKMSRQEIKAIFARSLERLF